MYIARMISEVAIIMHIVACDAYTVCKNRGSCMVLSRLALLK